ncbi:EF hand [Roseimaritima multifibrata]|uniref:EF hand n=1 Tax=Roseimaritima multifibrata TaxID=1930274 RepID=A0A517MMG1_9BACT|nr:hypothetical protein [Roseimaritima multifibrata]QDS96040.1 EF hand [Roseimaritima multifibrata]
MNALSKLLCSAAMLTFTTTAFAQPPGGGRGGRGQGGPSPVERLMTLDVNGDGQLTVNEVTDARMKPMLNRADTNQDGAVTKAELTAMFGGQSADGRPGGPGGAGGGMRGGPGGGGPPEIGQIIPSFLQEQLGLSEEQQSALAKLQAEVDAQLALILTAEQQQQLKQGPGGPGGPGGQQGGGRERAGRGRPPADN